MKWKNISKKCSGTMGVFYFPFGISVFSNIFTIMSLSYNKILKWQIKIIRIKKLTSFSWTYDHNLTERSIPFIVINANLHFKGSKRRDTFISINEFWSFRGCHHFFLPATCSIGPESHNIAKAFPILKLFRYWLKKKNTINYQQNNGLKNPLFPNL